MCQIEELSIQLEYDIRQGDKSLVLERFSHAEQQGCAKGGRRNVIASIIAGRDDSSNTEDNERDSFKRETERGKTQEKDIEVWAKKDGCWYNNTVQTGEQIKHIAYKHYLYLSQYILDSV